MCFMYRVKYHVIFLCSKNKKSVLLENNRGYYCFSCFQPQNESGSHRNLWMRRAQKPKNLFLVSVDPVGSPRLFVRSYVS